jgi:uncharacterized membrane protein YoaK (UPF0700 family)
MPPAFWCGLAVILLIELSQPTSVPINYMRRLAGPKRTSAANRQLGLALAFVAGAVNAGGFMAIGQYTSHMTGIVSSVAESLVLGSGALALAALGAAGAFMLGAASTAIMVNFGRRRGLYSEYALPLLVEAVLLLVFGVLGARLSLAGPAAAALTVTLLCYVMGLQNALVTKLSRAEIRTTHMTGIITDIGIELGKLAYRNVDASRPPVRADRGRLRLLSSLLACFIVGGIGGAAGFTYVGYRATLPLAALLCVLAVVPAADDVLRSLMRARGRR